MTEQTEITWAWDNRAVHIGVNRAGTGPNLLLLPALSAHPRKPGLISSSCETPHEELD